MGAMHAAQGTQHAVRPAFSTMCREKSKDWSSHSIMLISRMRVPALMRKPFTFCHTWVSDVVQGGQAVGGQLQYKGGGLPGEEGMLEEAGRTGCPPPCR